MNASDGCLSCGVSVEYLPYVFSAYVRCGGGGKGVEDAAAAGNAVRENTEDCVLVPGDRREPSGT
jgi:hypothetical protein